MATSGSFTGARGGTSTGPYLTLDWSRTQTDVTNNRSLIHLTLKLHSDYSINFSGNKTGLLQGTSYTYSGGMTSPGVVTLKELDVWVNHNSDGTLTTTFSGTFDLNISWSGVNTGTISVSGSATIDTIPRSSVPTLSATTFDMGTTITIYTNRASTDFTHNIIYTFGSSTANIALGVADSCTWAVPVSLADVIPNYASGWGSITCNTYNSSGTLIGSQNVNFTANVPSSFVPTVSGLSVAIDGTGQDKTLNKYVQNITKILSSFTAAGIHSSTISASSITVKRQSDNADLQTISGTNGTTSNPVALSGTYIVTASATDSRGRTASVTATFTVDAYSKPTITTFTTARDGTTTTTVNATLNLSWSPLGTSNTANISVVGVNNVGTSATLYTLNGSTAGLLNTTQAYTSQSDASSYTYTLTVTDTFGNTATAIATVSTSFAEFTIAKGKGVGVGKVWQQGALDVGGDAYVSGLINGKLGYTSKTGNRSSSTNTWVRICTVNITAQYQDYNTVFEVASNGSGSSKMYGGKITFRVKQQNAMASAPYIHLVLSDPIQFTPANFVAVTTTNTASATTVELWAQINTTYDGLFYSVLYCSSSTAIVWDSNYAIAATYSTGTVTSCVFDDTDTVVDSGSNSNGTYVKYNSGLMICWNIKGIPSPTTGWASGVQFLVNGNDSGNYYQYRPDTWTFPATFNVTKTKPAVFNNGDFGGVYPEYHQAFSPSATQCSLEDGVLWSAGVDGVTKPGLNNQLLAIGWWK